MSSPKKCFGIDRIVTRATRKSGEDFYMVNTGSSLLISCCTVLAQFKTVAGIFLALFNLSFDSINNRNLIQTCLLYSCQCQS